MSTIRTAQGLLDAWDSDQPEPASIYEVFAAIFGREYEDEDGDALSHIWAAAPCLSRAEAARVIRALA